MPEGHLIHHIARRHRAELTGREIAVSSPQRRFAAEAATIDGQRLDAVEAYGKHLFHRFGRWVVHVHLGQQGTFLWFPSPAPDPRQQVRLRLAAETGVADLIAPSTCRLGPFPLRDAVVSSLGPDPLREDADVDLVRKRFASDRRPIGAVLLDQSVIAGVGNVIRTEALFLEGLDPWMPAAALDRPRFDRLWATLTGIMERSAVDGRIVTVDGVGRDARFVYKREACRRCGATVERPIVGGRRMYRCPTEQPSWSAAPAAAEPPN